MPRALIIGLDLDIRDNPPVSEILAHERAVKAEFLSGLNGWTADILLVTKRTIPEQNDTVITLVPELYYGGVEIVRWVTANHADYNLFIMSYVVDSIYRNYLKAIPTTIGKPLFMPMPNQASEWNRPRTNIINVGAGASVNTRGFGEAIWFHDVASNGSTLTSYTTATVARKATQAISAGATSFEQVASVLIANGASYSEANGYGRLPETLVIPSPIPAYAPIHTETAPNALPQPPFPFPLEPTPEPDPIPSPDPAPELPAYNPTPSVFVTRAGNRITTSTDGGGSVTEYQRRTSIIGEWESTTNDFVADPAKTYIIRARVTDGVTFSEWGQSFVMPNAPPVAKTPLF